MTQCRSVEAGKRDIARARHQNAIGSGPAIHRVVLSIGAGDHKDVRCGALGGGRHGGNRRGIAVGGACNGQRGGRLAFEGGADVDVAHALRVAQSACASAEAEIGEVGAAKELRSDVRLRDCWCERNLLTVEGVAQRRRCSASPHSR